MEISGNVTCFGQDFLEKVSNHEIMKDQETRFFRKESLRELLSIFCQSSKSWTESIRAVIHPVREDIFKRKNLLNGNLNSKNQGESLSPFLLALMSMLNDGEVNVKGKCS